MNGLTARALLLCAYVTGRNRGLSVHDPIKVTSQRGNDGETLSVLLGVFWSGLYWTA